MIKKQIKKVAFAVAFFISLQINGMDNKLFFSPENESAGGTVSMTFTSISNNTGFSPKHILAAWVENQEGIFVKSLKVQADKRKQYLYTWNQKSSGNTTDATTGATLSNHQTHTVTWNLTDIQGALVEDGNYIIRVEYTSAHAQGPLLSVGFLKGNDPVTYNPGNETYFENISLTYTPDAATGVEGLSGSGPRVYPIPVTDRLIIDNARDYRINIFDSTGKLTRSFTKISADHVELDLSGFKAGSYIVIGTSDDRTFRKIIQVME